MGTRYLQLLVSILACNWHLRERDRLIDDGLVAVIILPECMLCNGQESDTIDADVCQSDIGFPHAIRVGDIENGDGRIIDTTCTTGLESHTLHRFLPGFWVLASAGLDLRTTVCEVSVQVLAVNLATRAKAGTAVRRAGEDPAKSIALHELQSQPFDAVACVHESLGDGSHVLAFLGACALLALHGDDTHVILLVQPDEQVLLVVVEDTTGVGPVATHTTGQEKCGVGLLK